MKDAHIFQIIDLNSDDLTVDGGDGWNDKHFVITMYGKTKEGKNVVCNISGFRPYFFFRLPGNWGESGVRTFLKLINKFINSYKTGYNVWNGMYEQDLLEVKRYYNFYGLNYDIECNKISKFKFAKVCFKDYKTMRNCISAIQDFHKINLPKSKQNKIIMGFKGKDKKPIECLIDKKYKDWFEIDNGCDCTANLYESKIHPLLRFVHEKKINTCGWVKVTVPNERYIINEKDNKCFNVDIEIKDLPLKYIEPYTCEEIAGFITASFDIECDSSHGDFPNPNKDFKKLAIDIHETFFTSETKLNPNNLIRIQIKKWIKEAFNGGSNNIQSIYTLNGIYSEDSLEEIMDRFDDHFIDALKSSKETSKKREIMINKLTDVFNTLENEDGECIKVEGDPIIQIGTAFHRYGDKECYDRSMVIIGNDKKPNEEICDDIEGIHVYRCKSEKELLLKWKDLMLYHNPDLITGYNIFGFDFDYLNKRVDFLFPCHSNCKRTKTYSNCCKDCSKNDFYRLGRLMRNRDSDIIDTMDVLSKPKKTLSSYNDYWEKKCQVVKKELSSSGLGDNILNYISMDGRVIFDIQKEIQKGHSLDSYKLDDVSAHFMKGRIVESGLIKTDTSDYITMIYTNTLGNLKKGDYITINLITKYGSVKYGDGEKFKIKGLNTERVNSNNLKTMGIIGKLDLRKYKKDLISYEWCLAKDDVSPQDIFNFHKNGGSSGRAKVAKYCIMDCELCIHLLLQLDLIPNNIGMATVSSVPLSYIFLRGQGIKISSISTKVCSEKETRIPTLKNFSESKMDDGFEGAIVLEPTPGIYLDDPVSVLDYASLYPSSIIEKNFSHETYICTEKEREENPNKFNKILEKVDNFKVSYDDYESIMKGKTIHKLKKETQTTCYFAKPTKDKEGNIKRGIIPVILDTLLDQRKKTRAKIKKTSDENKKKVLDGLQLAYKITANSVYGQMGAKTSSIFFKKIAACTTSIGRERIYDARDGVVEWAEINGYNKPEVVYGDTDSVFVKFSRIHHETGKELEGREALEYCIHCGVKSGEWITEHKMNPDWDTESSGKGPQDLEYEKTFWPFILISKKRYTGDKYELQADKPKERTSMGIVMKRRDNAPIVKYVFGNVIEIIMNQKNIDLAIEWLRKTLQKIKDGKMNQSMFVVSKSLRGFYKNPEGIAHKVLADRMAERNPGNKPKPNDRIPYAYFKLPDEQLYDYDNRYKSGKRKGQPREKKILQGDRIEHPEYITQKKLKIDYSFYISNQIMNPVKQVLDLEKSEEETTLFFNQFI
tara:strand:- start:3932 stop:7768 length:3837 start_codon:yes stop_codon:yes gene_type:complete